MSTIGIGSAGSLQTERLVTMRRQLDELQRRLGTQQKSETYAGLGPDRGLTIGLRTRLTAIDAYSGTIGIVDARLDLSHTALTELGDAVSTVKAAIPNAGYKIVSGGRTQNQMTAEAQLDRVLQALNTRFGDQYIFSGRSPDVAAVESTEHILGGDGVRAGLSQVTAERKKADLGTSGLGRLVIPASVASAVSIREDVDGSVFGFKLDSVTTSVVGATTTQPTGSPKAMTVDLGAAPVKVGDTVTFKFTLPDGTTDQVVLTASDQAKSITGTGGFAGAGATVGGTPAPITIHAPGLNGGTPITVTPTAADTAATMATKINTALAGATTGTDGIVATVVSGQLVIESRNSDVVTLGGDTATLGALGFAANNRVGTPNANTFAIGETSADTAASLQVALGKAVGTLARTSLTAASAVQAGREFFAADATHAPLRVPGPNFETATALVAGSAADTVLWYTGEAGAGTARATATARIDSEITVSYGLRANEDAFRSPIASIAVMAAMTFDVADSEGQVRYNQLMQRLQVNFEPAPGTQKAADITADLASAQKAMETAKDRHVQTTAALTDLLQNIENVPIEETTAQILALQTSLQASLQTTALLSKLSLVNYL